MNTTIPSLGALRAFDSAARVGSFVKAGEELSITPGAIGYQIRVLEESIGAPLFERLANGIVLTEIGRRFARRVEMVLEELQDAMDEVTRAARRSEVVIRCQISFGIKWLIPHLLKFRTEYPHIAVMVRTEPEHIEPFAGGADLAVYFSRGDLKNVRQDVLVGGRIIAAASPDCVSRYGVPTDLSEFANLPRIDHVSLTRGWRQPTWSTWLAQGGVANATFEPSLTLSLHHLVIEAAVRGAGYALVNDIFGRRIAPIRRARTHLGLRDTFTASLLFIYE